MSASAWYSCHNLRVSMESGLEGRNNPSGLLIVAELGFVSMESGLEGRNNVVAPGEGVATDHSSQWSPA